jgi:hypothetical protein
LLPRDAFFKGNLSFALPTVFQTWQRKQTPRNLPKKITPQYFEFVEKSQACFCVCRSGNAGHATISLQDKKKSHYYFIKLLNGKNVQDLVNEINKTSIIERDFNIGTPSINKQELTYYINKLITGY